MSLNLSPKEVRLQKIVDEIESYAIILLDLDGYIENWNKGAEQIKGYKAQEIIGQHFRIFYTPKDRESRLPEKLIAEAAQNGKAQYEGWRLKKNGERFWGSVLITAIHDENNQVIGFTKVTRDLTDKKISRETLRRSEDRYSLMVAEVQDYAIILMDLEGNIENWNKGAEQIKGYKAEEIIGKNFRLFYTEEDKKVGKPDNMLEKAIREGRSQDEGWRLRKDGSRFWGSITIVALHDDLNNIIGFSKLTRDLTERKNAEDTLRCYVGEL
ncbi:MAG: PAS domain-containing protein, partial [Candidatus Caenarcaniphilales bacterium]|nr:PAS domain-containing protein [Candidatus Caenarcaniphilales bacterium]